LFVTTGLDPVVHAALTISMGCRIKSGNDDGGPSGAASFEARLRRAPQDDEI
jgi:hypothetical protein